MPAESFNDTQSVELAGSPLVVNNGPVGAFAQPDLTKALRHTFVLTQNCTVVGPSSPKAMPPGTVLYLEFIQDGTGSRTVTWDASYRDGPSWGSSGPVGSIASAEFRANSAGGWQFAGGSTTFAVAGQARTLPVGSLGVQGAPPVVNVNSGIAPGAGSVAVTGQAVTRTP